MLLLSALTLRLSLFIFHICSHLHKEVASFPGRVLFLHPLPGLPNLYVCLPRHSLQGGIYRPVLFFQIITRIPNAIERLAFMLKVYANSWGRLNRNVRGALPDRPMKYQDSWLKLISHWPCRRKVAYITGMWTTIGMWVSWLFLQLQHPISQIVLLYSKYIVYC